MNCDIRKVQIGDERQLAYIQVESWRTAYRGILSPDILRKYEDIEYVTNIYKKLLENNKGNGLVMEVEGKNHCIAYWDKERNSINCDVAEIICIHSLPDNWRKGYGSKMMKKMLEDIAERGYSKVVLWVFEKNQRARLFYEANGFQVTDKVQPALGSTEICYSKNLKYDEQNADLLLMEEEFLG